MMTEKERQFITFVEIPVWVHYDFQPEERMALTYPGCKAEITLNEIEVADDIAEWIMDKNKDTFLEQAWEDLEGEKDDGRY